MAARKAGWAAGWVDLAVVVEENLAGRAARESVVAFVEEEFVEVCVAVAVTALQAVGREEIWEDTLVAAAMAVNWVVPAVEVAVARAELGAASVASMVTALLEAVLVGVQMVVGVRGRG